MFRVNTTWMYYGGIMATDPLKEKLVQRIKLLPPRLQGDFLHKLNKEGYTPALAAEVEKALAKDETVYRKQRIEQEKADQERMEQQAAQAANKPAPAPAVTSTAPAVPTTPPVSSIPPTLATDEEEDPTKSKHVRN
jgi:hypothetical protein